MSFKLTVFESDYQANWFIDFLRESGFYETLECTIDDCVIPWGGRDIKDTNYIEFETEQQALIFILRWQHGN